MSEEWEEHACENHDDDLTVIKQVIDDFQEGSSLADLSGQIEEYIREETKISPCAIAGIADAIGEETAAPLAAYIMVQEFPEIADTEEAANNWFILKHDDEEWMIGQRLGTEIARQIASQMFVLGTKYGKALAKTHASHA